MTIQANIAAARRVALEVFGGPKNAAVLDEVFAPDYVEHNLPPGLPAGLEGIKQIAAMFKAAFPDCEYVVDVEFGSGDYVAHRVTARATMTGEFMGTPPTGKAATWTETHIVRFANGKIVEHWGNQDDLGMLQQLGLIPTPESA
jgi:predicted ester cyclase